MKKCGCSLVKATSVAACSVLFASLFTSDALAANRIWTGQGGNNVWSTSGNWDSGVPGAGDNAIFNDAATVTVTSSFSLQTLTANAPVTVTIASGATLAFMNAGALVIDVKADTVIDGDGAITLSRAGTDELNFADLRPVAGVTLTIAARITGEAGSGVELNAAGTLVLTNPLNSYTGYTRCSTGGGVILFTHPGALGLGIMRCEQSAPSKFAYIGAGAATLLNPVGLTAGSPLIENLGGGALAINGGISAITAGGKTLTLATPGGQPIVVNSTIANGDATVSLIHAGPALLTLNGALSHTGYTTFRADGRIDANAALATGNYTVESGATLTLGPAAVIGGATIVNTDSTLAIEHGAAFDPYRSLAMAQGAVVVFNATAASTFSATLPLTNNLNGAGARWLLPSAATASTVTVPELFRASVASLDITADLLGTAQNTLFINAIGGVPTVTGPLPGWLTVNGGPAVYDATLGVMAATATGGTVSLAALGPSTIPNAPTAAAVIDAKGTAGDITLAADPTGIFSLTQTWALDPARVNLGGKTLVTSLVEIDGSGHGLTIGNGRVTAPSALSAPSGAAVLPTLPAAPIAWFDFADASTVTTDPGGRITGVENKGSAGPALDAAVPLKFEPTLYATDPLTGMGVSRTTALIPQQGLATLGNTGISGNAARTLFLVASRSPVMQTQFYAVYLGDDVSGNNRDFCIVERATQSSFSTKGNDINYNTASPPGINVLTFITGMDDPNDGAGYRNGVFLERKTFAFDTIDTPMFINHRPNGNTGNYSGPGDVAEILLFDYTLEEADRAAVEDYLMRKWSVVPVRGDSILALRNANAASDLAVPAAVTDPYGASLALFKSGPGDVTLSGLLTLSGPVRINEGNLIFDTPAGDFTSLHKPVSGPGALVKKGPGDLALNQTNPYTGGTLIQDGTLFTGDFAGTLGAGPVRIEGTGALDIRYGARPVPNAVSVEGFGPDGLGALRNSSLHQGQNSAFVNVTLTDDAAFYASQRFDVRNGAFDFGGHNLTLNGGNQFSIVNAAVSGVTPGVSVHSADGIFNFESSDFKGSAANVASTAPGAGIALYGMGVPMLWSLDLADGAFLRVSDGTMSTDTNVWAGPVTLSGGTASFNALANGTATITGAISGPGGILKEGPGWFWLLNPSNPYAGATSVTQGSLYAVSPGSVGTSGNISVKGAGASFIVRAASATSPDGWPAPAMNAAIATAGTFESDTFLGIDTCYDDFVFSGSYPFIGLKKLGSYKLTLQGTAPDLGSLIVYDGELDLTSTGAHNLHGYSAFVGYQPDSAMLATLRLADTTLEVDDPGYNNASAVIGAGIAADARGILHIGADTLVRGRLSLGDQGGSVGAIYQTSGVVTNIAGTGNESNIGYYGYGYYRLDDGELAIKGSTFFGRNTGATGIFEQRGGALRLGSGGAPGNGVIGDYYNGTLTTRRGVAQFMLSGGTFDLWNHSFQLGEWNAADPTQGYAALTLENDAQMTGVTDFNLANRNEDAQAFVNLNGGSLTVKNRFLKGGNNAAGNTSRAAIAFNGGTLIVSPPSATPLSLVQTGANNAPALLNVYPGGANIDIASPVASVLIAEPLRAPPNLGVTAVSITSPGQGYIAPPAITFTGGNGTGATAFAEIDLGTGEVTSIRMTSPGVGYTAAPTVVFRGGGTVNATATASIGLNASGGLTKLGPGLLSLNAENTYTGPTVVSNGTLRLAAGPHTLTPYTPITLAGGTLDLGGDTHTTYTPVTIEDGSLINGALAAPAITKTGPDTATLSATPSILNISRYESFILSLGPVAWYDPSDTSPGNVELLNDRVVMLRNKGTAGSVLNAVPYPVGTGRGPLYTTSISPLGAGVMRIDAADAALTTIGDVPLTGTAPRTIVAMMARDDSTVNSGRACVGIGSGAEGWSFELGNDGTKTYLSGIGAARDTQFEGMDGLPPLNHLTFSAGANTGWNNNFARDVQIWRYIDDVKGLESKTASWPADMNTASAPFSFSRRGGAIYRGIIGEVLLFDRILSPAEIEALKDVLVAKYMVLPEDGGTDSVIPPVLVEEGTLRLSPALTPDIIANMNPLLWYDPSDASAVTTDAGGRILSIANKGSKANMDAAPGYVNNTAPLLAPRLVSGEDSHSPVGLPMINIDIQNAGLASSGTIGISGNAPRTVVGIFARNKNTTTAGPVVAFGSNGPNGQLWEVGDRHSSVVIGGFGGGNYDLVVTPQNPEGSADVFIATYAAGQGVAFWRTLTEPMFASNTASTYDTAVSPFLIGQRPGVMGREDFYGQIGEVVVFDRVLNGDERNEIQRYLVAKWLSDTLNDGTEFDNVVFDVATGATLDLGSNTRANITVTGGGTIANGVIGDGAVISPAGDDAIGTLALDNVAFGAGSVYRLTTGGALSDCLLVDGNLGNLTIVPAADVPLAYKEYLVATGVITGLPALDGFDSKYKLLLKGRDLYLTSIGGTVLILK